MLVVPDIVTVLQISPMQSHATRDLSRETLTGHFGRVPDQVLGRTGQQATEAGAGEKGCRGLPHRQRGKVGNPETHAVWGAEGALFAIACP